MHINRKRAAARVFSSLILLFSDHILFGHLRTPPGATSRCRIYSIVSRGVCSKSCDLCVETIKMQHFLLMKRLGPPKWGQLFSFKSHVTARWCRNEKKTTHHQNPNLILYIRDLVSQNFYTTKVGTPYVKPLKTTVSAPTPSRAHRSPRDIHLKVAYSRPTGAHEKKWGVATVGGELSVNLDIGPQPSFLTNIL